MKLKIKESWGCRGCYFNAGNCTCNEREQCIDQVIHNCAREEIIYLEEEDNSVSTTETLQLDTSNIKFYMQFNDPAKDYEFVGKFFLNDDNQIDFEGNATESARMFIEEVKRQWRIYK